MKQQLSIWVSVAHQPTLRFLRKLAARDGRSLSSYIFEAVEFFIDHRTTIMEARELATQMKMPYEVLLHEALEDYMTRNQVV
jgi:hypothetical protein